MSKHPKYDEFVRLLHIEVPDVTPLCQECVLNNKLFQEFPASPNKHHTYEGGLFDHTLEVVQAAIGIINLNASLGKTLDRTVILTACVFHDYGKIFDYEKIVVQPEAKILWVKNEHYQKIHHIVKSYSHLLEAASDADYTWREEVAHCILAHHGKLEYGSPVVPFTQEAWTVHLADMISVMCIEKRAAEPTSRPPRPQQ